MTWDSQVLGETYRSLEPVVIIVTSAELRLTEHVTKARRQEMCAELRNPTTWKPSLWLSKKETGELLLYEQC